LRRYSQLVPPIPNKVSFGDHRIGEEMKPLATALRCRIGARLGTHILSNSITTYKHNTKLFRLLIFPDV
jgi:hypothetical protein